MLCPECDAEMRIRDSRAIGGYVRRRRACPEGHRFTSYEVIPRGGEVLVVRQGGDGRLTTVRRYADPGGEIVLARELEPSA